MAYPDVQQSDTVEDKTMEYETLPSEPTSNCSKGEGEVHAQIEIKEGQLNNKKRHLNIVVIGHADSGKSTIGGTILHLMGGPELFSRYMEYTEQTDFVARRIMSEVEESIFETENTSFTIFDAHGIYIPNMIRRASLADVGVLVVSAREAEFETDYEEGGQTCEHIQLANALGVSKLVVVINKTDDPMVRWSKARYDEIEGKLIPFLKSSGYNLEKDVQFLPISGLLGSNITRADKRVCSWWNGPCLLDILDTIDIPLRDPKAPLRMPIFHVYTEKNVLAVVIGKIESGSICSGDILLVMPTKIQAKVVSVVPLRRDRNRATQPVPGEIVRVRMYRLSRIAKRDYLSDRLSFTHGDILRGFVLSSVYDRIGTASKFVAQLHILGLRDNEIFTTGYQAVLYIHAIVEECEVLDIMVDEDPVSKKRMAIFARNGEVVRCLIKVNKLISLEKFSAFTQLARCILRNTGRTIAVGKVVDLHPDTGS